jgi:DNA-binding transcriptional ArsR family regulator
MRRAQEALGPRAEIIAGLDRDYAELAAGESVLGDVLALLARRPCTAQDIAGGLSLHVNEVTKHLGQLLREGRIHAERQGGKLFYRAVSVEG